MRSEYTQIKPIFQTYSKYLVWPRRITPLEENQEGECLEASHDALKGKLLRLTLSYRKLDFHVDSTECPEGDREERH